MKNRFSLRKRNEIAKPELIPMNVFKANELRQVFKWLFSLIFINHYA